MARRAPPDLQERRDQRVTREITARRVLLDRQDFLEAKGRLGQKVIQGLPDRQVQLELQAHQEQLEQLERRD